MKRNDGVTDYLRELTASEVHDIALLLAYLSVVKYVTYCRQLIFGNVDYHPTSGPMQILQF